MTKLKGRGGPGRGQGRKPKPVSELYVATSLKLPPDVMAWLKANTDNRNGFIVDAIREKIEYDTLEKLLTD